jgi:hypothetical protein
VVCLTIAHFRGGGLISKQSGQENIGREVWEKARRVVKLGEYEREKEIMVDIKKNPRKKEEKQRDREKRGQEELKRRQCKI